MNSPKDEKKPIDHKSAKRMAEWAQHMHPTGTGFRDVCDAYLDLAAQVESLKARVAEQDIEEHRMARQSAENYKRAKAGDLLRDRIFSCMPSFTPLVRETLLAMLEETDPNKSTE